MINARWNRPKVGRLLKVLEQIQKARGVMVGGTLFRKAHGSGDWTNHDRDTGMVNDALLEARDEIEILLIQAARRGKTKGGE